MFHLRAARTIVHVSQSERNTTFLFKPQT